MGELARIGGISDELATIDLAGEMGQSVHAAFEQRGRLTGGLVVATLTESSYTFSGSEGPTGYVLDEEAEEPARVDKACELLRQGQEADVPGSKRLRLESYRTNYGKILGKLQPGRRDPASARRAYEQGFEQWAQSEESEFGVESLVQAVQIIRGAPKSLSGFRLEDKTGSGDGQYRMITTEGRAVTLEGRKRYSENKPTYWLTTDTQYLGSRRGRIPNKQDLLCLQRRIIAVRTRHNQR